MAAARPATSRALPGARFRLAQVAPVKAGRSDHQGRLVVADNFADFFVIQGIGIGNNRHAVIERGPEIAGKPEYMKIRQVRQES